MKAAITLGAAAVAAAAWTVYRRRKTPPKKAIRVTVASKCSHKVLAAQRALGAGTCEGVEAPSGVSDQPVGLTETVRGARNRMAMVLEAEAQAEATSRRERADFAVAIENGIVSLQGDEETWVDLAVVVLVDLSTGAEALSTSTGVQFPTSSVGEWAEGGSEGTVGDCIADELKCDKQDPHAALTKQQFSRAALLEQAIRVAASTLGSDGAAAPE